MLVLSRNTNEVIVFTDMKTGEVISEVQILRIRGDQVVIGITAPDSIVVDREEIHLRKLEEAEQNERLHSA
jgi:carbon storage regulator CsrA